MNCASLHVPSFAWCWRYLVAQRLSLVVDMASRMLLTLGMRSAPVNPLSGLHLARGRQARPGPMLDQAADLRASRRICNWQGPHDALEEHGLNHDTLMYCNRASETWHLADGGSLSACRLECPPQQRSRRMPPLKVARACASVTGSRQQASASVDVVACQLQQRGLRSRTQAARLARVTWNDAAQWPAAFIPNVSSGLLCHCQQRCCFART